MPLTPISQFLGDYNNIGRIFLDITIFDLKSKD